jgi:hypothetical protein
MDDTGVVERADAATEMVKGQQRVGSEHSSAAIVPSVAPDELESLELTVPVSYSASVRPPPGSEDFCVPRS